MRQISKGVMAGALLVGVLVAEAPTAGAATEWSGELIPIPGWTDGAAQGINDDGVVVGDVYVDDVGYRGFVWDPADGLTILGLLPGVTVEAGGESFAVGVNDLGLVVGNALAANDQGVAVGHHAFVWESATGMTDLGLLAGTDPEAGNSYAADANNAGQVVGWGTVELGYDRPFVWTESAGMVELPLLAGHVWGKAHAINDSGQIVGESVGYLGDGSAEWRAVLWEGGSVVDLGTLAGAEPYMNRANDINASGWIVGRSSNAAVLWHPTEGIVELPMPAGGGYDASVANAINDSGQIVGGVRTVVGARPVLPSLWEGETVTVLPTPYGTGGGDYPRAYDLNAAGVVVGSASIGRDEQPARWTSTEVPDDTEPPVLTLPADMPAEPSGLEGAVVDFAVSATDAVDGVVPVVCDPASGSTFPFGETIVECSASDAAGNTANGSFKVIVVDTTGPVITVPDDMKVDATGPAGATVLYVVSAVDVAHGVASLSCTPPSGAQFPVGPTTVQCSATDTVGNTSTASFSVEVVALPVNQPPVAMPSRVATDEDDPVSFTLQASDPDGDPLTFTITQQPVHGRLSCSGRTCTYTPDRDWNGTDALTFRVSDGQLSATARIDIAVRRVPDRPRFNSISTSPSVAWHDDWGYEGATRQLYVTFTDPDGQNPNNFDITVYWDDGSSTNIRSGQITRAGDQYSFEVSHAYKRFGTKSLQVRIIDQTIPEASANRRHDVAVYDAPLTGSRLSGGRATVGRKWQSSSGSPFVVACVFDANPYGLKADLSAVIRWGDGTQSAGKVVDASYTVVHNGESVTTCAGGWDFAIAGVHTYRTAGDFTMRIEVTSEGGSSTVATVTNFEVRR